MPQLAIVTDSTTGIPDQLLNELRIHTVTYYIHRGKEVLRDHMTIDIERLYKWLPGAGEPPPIASPGPGDYIIAYQQVVEEQFCEISPALGVHTRPGTAGLCYFPVLDDE
jgi:fatty acid-binding protein DegV